MVYDKYNRGTSEIAMKEWLNNYPNLPAVDSEFSQIRADIKCYFEYISKEIGESEDKYKVDYLMGLFLYDYFWKLSWFSMRVASDDNFWRYLSVVVVPDVVASRWGKDNETRYWSKPVRIWLRQVWWYIHLSWQGSMDATKKVVETEFFTTDTILNSAERPGRSGTYIDTYRQLIKVYSKFDTQKVKKLDKAIRSKTHEKRNSLFRVVMKLHTAKVMVMDPALCMDGEEGYAKSLFDEVEVTFDAS